MQSAGWSAESCLALPVHNVGGAASKCFITVIYYLLHAGGSSVSWKIGRGCFIAVALADVGAATCFIITILEEIKVAVSHSLLR